jgi:antitoxin (DNA-binding transcriptional repressor) of toxin-antitoxin stability system
MRTVEIKQLKDRLSEYVRLAAAGETVVVTDRGRIAAELGPSRWTHRGRTTNLVIAEWVWQGLATPPTLPRGTRPRRHRLIAHDQLMADLARDRGDW